MRSRLLIVVGVLVGLLLAGGVLFFLTQMQGGGRPAGATPVAQEETPEPTQPIVVAVQDIPACSEFVEGSVEVRDWPIAHLPPNPVTDLSELSGKIALVDIYRGEPVLQDMIVQKGAGGGAACFIPPGKVALALPISRQSSVAYAVEKGDHVDVLISYRLWDEDEQLEYAKSQVVPSEEGAPLPEPALEPIARLVTQMTVQDATVLKVGQWAFEPPPAPQAEGEPPPPPPPPDIIVVIVDPQDAAVLKFARESGASPELALRASASEGQQVSTEAVTLEYMVTRFGITPPTRSPYRLFLPQVQQPVAPAD